MNRISFITSLLAKGNSHWVHTLSVNISFNSRMYTKHHVQILKSFINKSPNTVPGVLNKPKIYSKLNYNPNTACTFHGLIMIQSEKMLYLGFVSNKLILILVKSLQVVCLFWQCCDVTWRQHFILYDLSEHTFYVALPVCTHSPCSHTTFIFMVSSWIPLNWGQCTLFIIIIK